MTGCFENFFIKLFRIIRTNHLGLRSARVHHWHQRGFDLVQQGAQANITTVNPVAKAQLRASSSHPSCPLQGWSALPDLQGSGMLRVCFKDQARQVLGFGLRVNLLQLRSSFLLELLRYHSIRISISRHSSISQGRGREGRPRLGLRVKGLGFRAYRA